MSCNHLLCLLAVARLLDSPNVQRPVLAVEAADTAHVVSVVCELVAREAVFRGVGHGVGGVGERMAVFAFPAVRAASACEEEADVFHSGCVGAGEP